MKHTPGPWRVDSPTDAGDVYIETTHLELVAIVPLDHGTGALKSRFGSEIREANARLMAAAPEMREIIDAFIELNERTDDAAYRDRDEAIDDARAILARIDGVEP